MKKADHHIHHLSYAKVYKHLCENLDSNLDSEACRRIKAHLQGCENCSALLDSLKKTVFLYRSYPAPTLPAKAKKDLFAVIRLDKRSQKKTTKR